MLAALAIGLSLLLALIVLVWLWARRHFAKVYPQLDRASLGVAEFLSWRPRFSRYMHKREEMIRSDIGDDIEAVKRKLTNHGEFHLKKLTPPPPPPSVLDDIALRTEALAEVNQQLKHRAEYATQRLENAQKAYEETTRLVEADLTAKVSALVSELLDPVNETDREMLESIENLVAFVGHHEHKTGTDRPTMDPALSNISTQWPIDLPPPLQPDDLMVHYAGKQSDDPLNQTPEAEAWKTYAGTLEKVIELMDRAKGEDANENTEADPAEEEE